MFKLVVLAVAVACVSSSVVPKSPATLAETKHDIPAVKSTPLRPENQQENHKPTEVKVDVKLEDKAKSVSSQDNKSDEKEKKQHHQPASKKIEHHAALKHHEVPVNIGQVVKPDDEAHKPEKVENVKAKTSDHGH